MYVLCAVCFSYEEATFSLYSSTGFVFWEAVFCEEEIQLSDIRIKFVVH